MDNFDLGLNQPNNLLQDLVDNFHLNDDDLLPLAVAPQNPPVLHIENPTEVDCPEEALFFQLIDEMPPIEQNQQQQQFYVNQTEYQEVDEGKVIMANLTGFGSGTSLVKNEPMMQAPFDYSKVFVQIVEQPASHKLRFRYECEGRSAGSLQGEKSINDNKTYPTIQVVGYQGPAVVVVSCVEEKLPYRAHPHNLVGKGGIFKKGVCSMEITNPDMTCQFANLGIQCVKKKDAADSLTTREQIRVDPFKQGFSHKNGAINLNAVRLCFQVFLKNEPKLRPLLPVISNVIYDKKSHSDLQIIEVSDDVSPVEGGKKILLFCEKVDKNDIEVHFTFMTKSCESIIKKAEFSSANVHKQFGICLKTPQFHDLNITERVRVDMMLYKPSEQSYSEPVDFYYEPNPSFARNAPKNDAMMQPMKVPQVQKRAREPKQNHDEPSSGQIIRPTKAQFLGGGGQVTVVNDQQAKQDPMKIMFPFEQNGVNGQMPFIDLVEAATNQHRMIMGDPYPQPEPFNLNNLGGIELGVAIPNADIHVDGSFPNLDITSGDLVDNLSSSICGMTIDKKTTNSYHRQSSQLQTPDVSMDESAQRSGHSRRNNLNRL